MRIDTNLTYNQYPHYFSEEECDEAMRKYFLWRQSIEKLEEKKEEKDKE